MRRPNLKIALAAVLLPALGACSETSVMDAFDSGKSSPNEGLVTTNRPLSLPPDMALRQPGAASAPAPGNGLSVQQGQRGNPQYQYQAPQQPAYQQPQVQQQQAYRPPAVQQPQAQQPRQPAWQNQQQQAYQAPQQPAYVSPQDKPYYDLGINPYNPDGTRKKQSILNNEVRKKNLERKRASNPNYGTIFNMGELWSGN